MSLFAIPCIYINLGGEMLLILEQRLDALGIQGDKYHRVMKDIVASFLNERNLSSVFTSQPLLNRRRLKLTFIKLIHASTLTLSNDACDKLFDLMIMALKYKVMTCRSGHELLMLTLSHLDGIRLLMEGAPKHIVLVNKAVAHCIKLYHYDLSKAQMELVRQTVLNCVQDYHKKVAIFLSQKIQLPNGKFARSHSGTVPFGSEIPGRITYLQKDGKIEVVPLVVQYYRVEKKGSLDEIGDRHTVSQTNLYGHERKERARSISEELSEDTKNTEGEEETEWSMGESVGHVELDLLQHLLIGFKSSSSVQQEPFKLTLFEDEDNEEDKERDLESSGQLTATKSKREPNTVNISNSKSATSDVMKEIMQDFQEESVVASGTETAGDDLLSLMDTLQ